MLTARRLTVRLAIATLLLGVVMAGAMGIGSERVSIREALHWRADSGQTSPDYQILVRVRLPRVVIAALVGAALAGAGVVCQVLLRNGLADPYLLGVSSGAGLGATVAVLCGVTWTLGGGSAIAVCAFAGAVGAMGLVWCLGRWVGRWGVAGLVLAGVIVNAFLSALILCLVAVARGDQVHATLFWLMGNVNEEGPLAVWLAFGCVAACSVGLFFLSPRLNAVCFGDDQARAMGVDVDRVRWAAFLLSGLMTAVAVSLAGLVGFVGLVIPHAVRLVWGGDCRQLLPMAAIVGAAFLVACDTVCRVVVAPAQLPVGIVTALIGGPVFIGLLVVQGRRMEPLS
jgi:iron complex transport system permease protein